jgi:hypothetical protein
VANALLESINKKFDACRSINIKNEIQESINSYVLTKDFGKINVTDQTLNQRKEALKADVYQNLNNKLNEIKNDANPPAGIAENYDLISNIIKDSSSNK